MTVRTAAQAAASRTNGACSSGPATTEGKAASAQNASRHGLCSKARRYLPGEDPAEFTAKRDALLAQHAPGGEPDRVILVDQLAWNFFLRDRSFRLEGAHDDSLVQGDGDRFADPEAAILQDLRLQTVLTRYRSALWREIKDILKLLNQPPPPLARQQEEPDEPEPDWLEDPAATDPFVTLLGWAPGESEDGAAVMRRYREQLAKRAEQAAGPDRAGPVDDEGD